MELVPVYLAFILVLAIFLGFELISKVPATLHTPLMSGANAISGITIVGALLAAGAGGPSWLTTLLGSLAVFFATGSARGSPLASKSPQPGSAPAAERRAGALPLASKRTEPDAKQ